MEQSENRGIIIPFSTLWVGLVRVKLWIGGRECCRHQHQKPGENDRLWSGLLNRFLGIESGFKMK